MILGRRTATPFEKRIGYRFKQVAFLDLALTHRSFANEQGVEENYERLEFLGDAVLGLVTTEWLYRNLPGLPEGDLTKRKNHLVSKDVLAPYAREDVPRRGAPPGGGGGALGRAGPRPRSSPTPWRRSSGPSTWTAGSRRRGR